MTVKLNNQAGIFSFFVRRPCMRSTVNTPWNIDSVEKHANHKQQNMLSIIISKDFFYKIQFISSVRQCMCIYIGHCFLMKCSWTNSLICLLSIITTIATKLSINQVVTELCKSFKNCVVHTKLHIYVYIFIYIYRCNQ